MVTDARRTRIRRRAVFCGLALLVLTVASCGAQQSAQPIDNVEPSATIQPLWQFVLSSHEDRHSVAQVRYAPDGRKIASFGGEPRIVVLDAFSGKLTKELSSPALIHDLCFSPDGTTIFAVGQAGLCSWNTESWEQANYAGFSSQLVAMRDATTLVMADQHGWRHLNLAEMMITRSEMFDIPLLPLSLQPADGGMLATEGVSGGPDGRRNVLYWFDTSSRSSVAITSVTSPPKSAAIIPHENGLVAFATAGTPGIQVVPIDLNANSASEQPGARQQAARGVTSFGKTAVECLSPSNDGRWLLVGDIEGTLRLWELPTRSPIVDVSVGHQSIRSITFSPDRRALAAIVDDGSEMVILSFEITQCLPSPAPRPANVPELRLAMGRLGHETAEEAYAAIAVLLEEPRLSLPLIEECIRQQVVIPDLAEVERWIGELNSTEFSDRQTAFAKLSSVRDLIVPQLDEALLAGYTLETQLRLRQLRYAGTPDTTLVNRKVLEGLRLLTVLDLMHTPESIDLVRLLQVGHPSLRVRQSAALVATQTPSAP